MNGVSSLALWVLVYLLTPSSTTGCSRGLFGRGCRYMCQCANTDECNEEGQCLEGCKPGWFGNACQYADLSLGTEGPTWLTDGKDNTCNGQPPQIPVTVIVSTHFTWLQLVVNSADAHYSIDIVFDGVKTCNKREWFPLNMFEMDVHCKLTNYAIQNITLSGPGVQSLCSVHVSGGRNVAFGQLVSQCPESSPFLGAETGVDGNREQTCVQSRSGGKNRWCVRLSRQFIVTQYVVYRADTSSDLYLVAMDNRGNIQLQAKVEAGAVFRVGNSTDSLIQTVTLETSAGTLSFCELEVYGDTVCTGERFGPDCNHWCRCPSGNRCHVNTGACLKGCPPGFKYLGCTEVCDPGRYAENCYLPCSPQCGGVNHSCNALTGDCSEPCLPGYLGSKCTETCTKGTWGLGCSQVCSEECENQDCNVVDGACGNYPRSNGTGAGAGSGAGASAGSGAGASAGASAGAAVAVICSEHCALSKQCDPASRECKGGCKNGYLPPLCQEACPAGTHGQNCSKTCSLKCRNPKQCDPISGACIGGCVSGFRAATCHLRCPGGSYGPTCNNRCSTKCYIPEICNSGNGSCLDGCMPGFKPPLCHEKCEHGTYGENCQSMCPWKCDNRSCDPQTGDCLACAPGFGALPCDLAPIRAEGKGGLQWLLFGLAPFILLLVTSLLVSCGHLISVRHPRPRFSTRSRPSSSQASQEK